MIFSSRVPIPALVQWCRALKHGIDVGISPVKCFRQQGKSGPTSVRPLANTIADRLAQGASLEEAIRPFRSRFPLLFVELIAVGEQTGRLTETFEELERYFETVQQSRKDFLRALIWPAMSYFMAIVIIAILIAVLGLIGSLLDPTGLGLLGPKCAGIFLLVMTVFTIFVVGGFMYIRDHDGIRGKFEAISLSIPGLAGCFRAFALQRFSLALQMTAEAGLRADKALLYSFRATANSSYAKHAEDASKRARGGEEITEILTDCGPNLFTAEFLDSVQVGETSGQLAEVMHKQSKFYREEASRKLKILTMLAGGAVYLMIGLMIILVIARILMAIIGVYEDALKGVE